MNMANIGKNNKIIMIVFILLIILILLLVGYITYDKIIAKSGNSPTNENNIDKELNDSVLNNSLDSKGYKIIKDDKNNKKYLVEKDGSGYKVSYDFDYYIHYIGIYDDKLYYSDQKAIKYLTLSDNNLTENIWVELPKIYNYKMGIEKSAIIDDTLYFNFGIYNGVNDKYTGLLSLNMDAKNFDEYKQVINDVDEDKWYADENNSTIYYAQFNGGMGVIIYELDINNNTKTKLIDTPYIEDIAYSNGKILYFLYESDRYDSNWNKIYSCNCTPHNEIYIYDVNSKQTSLIAKTTKDDLGSLYGQAQFNDNKVYYIDNGVIYSYENENIKKYYTLSDVENYYAFNFINSNTMKIVFETKINETQLGSRTEYVVDGNSVGSLDKINVTMMDNSVNQFTIEDLEY